MEEWATFCRSLPKVELHAHLNGSVRDSTIRELAETKLDSTDSILKNVHRLTEKGSRSLSECFLLFDVIHRLTTGHATVTRITEEVIEDFANDNVRYLEIRTTPKNNPKIGMTKRSYLESVLKGVDNYQKKYKKNDEINNKQNTKEIKIKENNCEQDIVVDSNNLTKAKNSEENFENFKNDTNENFQKKLDIKSESMSKNGLLLKECEINCSEELEFLETPIIVRIILSIDRRENFESANETVELALQWRERGVVGVDLSGNPSVGHWSTFEPALNRAKMEKFPVTLHCGEIPNKEEVREMLKFGPQRVGHVCCLEEEEWNSLLLSNIPVELCLTSNVKTESVDSFSRHHFGELYPKKHPLILCTDDMGVFSTSLSEEYARAAVSFGLTKDQLQKISLNSIDHIFAPENIKQKLRKDFLHILGQSTV